MSRATSKAVAEFPDDDLVKAKFSLTAMEDYSSNRGTEVEQQSVGTDLRFKATVAVAVSFGCLAVCVAPLWPLLPGPVGLALSVVLLHFFREWFRIHGAALTRHPKALVNWRGVLSADATFIPGYELKWLFGSRYNPLVTNCCGADNLTADEPEARSPTKKTSPQM